MKTKSFFFWGTVCCCLFCFLQIWYPFYFYYVEQLQVFPLTCACFEETTQPASQPARLSACFLKTSPSERKNLQLFDIIKIKRIPYLHEAQTGMQRSLSAMLEVLLCLVFASYSAKKVVLYLNDPVLSMVIFAYININIILSAI